MSNGPNPKRELVLSLALLAGIVVFALLGLATDGNWPKILRVAAAFAAYAGILAVLLRNRGAVLNVADEIPFAWFAAAGSAAGLVSGLVRPEINPGTVVAGTVAAALLLGGVHCFALRYWRRFQLAGRTSRLTRSL